MASKYITFNRNDIHHVARGVMIKTKGDIISIRETIAAYAYPLRTATSPRKSMIHDVIVDRTDIRSVRIDVASAPDISEISELSNLLIT